VHDLLRLFSARNNCHEHTQEEVTECGVWQEKRVGEGGSLIGFELELEERKE
jgi:hypothetical protein